MPGHAAQRDGQHADTDDDRAPSADRTDDDGGDDRAALPDPGMDMAAVGHERILPRPPKRLGGMRRLWSIDAEFDPDLPDSRSMPVPGRGGARLRRADTFLALPRHFSRPGRLPAALT